MNLAPVGKNPNRNTGMVVLTSICIYCHAKQQVSRSQNCVRNCSARAGICGLWHYIDGVVIRVGSQVKFLGPQLGPLYIVYCPRDTPETAVF
eukprot:1347852-Amorphochlora_amoeboformis.AAC.1